MITKNTALSPEMHRCLDFVRRQGGAIHLNPLSGLWMAKEWRSGTGEAFRSSTVEALVARSVLAYSKWQDGRRGDPFPIEASLLIKHLDAHR